MVGVPGRSKACATCRRRKKGCDFLRPSCTQCLRAGLVCGGYERGRIFVHATKLHPSLVRESSFVPSPAVDAGPAPEPASAGAPAGTTSSPPHELPLHGAPAGDPGAALDVLLDGLPDDTAGHCQRNSPPHAQLLECPTARHSPDGFAAPALSPNGLDGLDGHAPNLLLSSGLANGRAPAYITNTQANGHAPDFVTSGPPLRFVAHDASSFLPHGPVPNFFFTDGVLDSSDATGDFKAHSPDGFVKRESSPEGQAAAVRAPTGLVKVDRSPAGLVHGHLPTFSTIGFAKSFTAGQAAGLFFPDFAGNGEGSARAPPRRSRAPPRRAPDLRIVPVYHGHIAESDPGADKPLTTAAEEELLLSHFWNAYLPNKVAFPSQANDFAGGGWTNIVIEKHRSDPILHYTLMANCFSSAARHYDARGNAEKSLRAHGRALHALRCALNNPKRARSDTVFTSLRLMIIFSMFFSDRYEEDRRARARGWKEHNAGVLALLRARGPEAHIEGHGHQMFVDCRLALIVVSIRLRKTTILSSPKWTTVPWTKIPKTPKDSLIDIMASIPTVLEGVDCLENMEPGDERDDQRRRLINSCWSLDQQLCDWYNGSSPKDRLHVLERNGDDVGDGDDDDDQFGLGSTNSDCFALPTEDLSVVYIMTIYCSACVLVYTTMQSLEIENLPQRARVSIYINKIATYLRIFFHPSTGQYGLEMTSFPLGLCLQILSSNFQTGGDTIRERAKFTRLLETERGKEILDFLRSMLNTNETTKAE